ncbi:MAG: hypothetical protein M0P14_08730 [Alkaliphilus sp.]|nr:hypothetical protein [Alkaliphilus sp.]
MFTRIFCRYKVLIAKAKGFEMNKVPSGGIAIGQAGSKARFDNSQNVCLDCIEKYIDSLYFNSIDAGVGTCDCCEKNKVELYCFTTPAC